MADAEKVIKAIEGQLEYHKMAGTSNSYNALVLADALELLKEQRREIEFLKPHYEPRKPTGIHIWHHGYIGHCPSCDRVVDFAERFCHNCTQLLDWSEVLEMPSEDDDG